MNLSEKLEVAKQLEKLRVDVIEAGFAIASPGDFAAVKGVADMIKDCSVASLARATEKRHRRGLRSSQRSNGARAFILFLRRRQSICSIN